MISPFVHGIIDYLYGISLNATPWILGFDKTSTETYLLYFTATIVFVYSLITKYQLSIAKILSMKTHLFIDAVISGFLISAPWLFEFSSRARWAYALFGAAGFTVILLSSDGEPTSVKVF